MAAAVDDPDTAQEAQGAAPSRLGGVLRLLSLAVIVVFVLSALWFLRSQQLFLSDAHRRNMAALSVAASGLQYWPESVRGIAQSQFVDSNVHAASPRQMLEGWDLAADGENPDLGQFQVLYAFAGPGVHRADGSPSWGSCDALQARLESKARLPFVPGRSPGSGPIVKVFGAMSLADLRSLDFTRLSPQLYADEDVAKIIKRAKFRPVRSPKEAWLCFGAEVPTSVLLQFEDTRDFFSNFLVVDGAKRIVQQVGEQPLPVETLPQLRQGSPSRLDAIAASVGGARAKAGDEADLSEAVGPQTVKIADRSYVAYVQPFHLPRDLHGCDDPASAVSAPAPGTPPGAAKPSGSKPAPAGTGVANAGPSTPCYLIGLVPTASLFRDAVSPPPLFVLTFGLINGLLICAFPIARLLFIGPNESLPRHNVPLIVGGAVVGVSLITLALLTWVDISFERQRAEATAKQVTSTLADAARRQVQDILMGGLAAEGKAQPGKAWDRVQLTPQPVGDTFAPPGDSRAVVGLENVIHLTAAGRPVACQIPVISTHASTKPRIDISGRDYFKRFKDGAFTGRWQDRGYVVGQVRSQTDGVNKAVMLVEAKGPERDPPPGAPAADGPGCRTDSYLIAGVIDSLLSPVLPRRFEMATVDAGDPTLPVKFHSKPERIGVEQLARDIDPHARRMLLKWLRYSQPGAMGDSGLSQAPKPYPFTAVIYGVRRQFFAERIAGTPWLLTVSYELRDVDQLPVARTSRAIKAGLPLALILLLVWWLTTLVFPHLARALWPHETLRTAGSRPGGLDAATHAHVAWFLLGLVAIEVLASFWLNDWWMVPVIAGLATSAVAILHAHAYAPSRLFGVLSPANERAFSAVCLAFLFAVSIVPTIDLRRDASLYVDAQERLRAAIEFEGPGGAIARHRKALELVAKSWFPATDGAAAGGPTQADQGPGRRAATGPNAAGCEDDVFVGGDRSSDRNGGRKCLKYVSAARKDPRSFYDQSFAKLEQAIPRPAGIEACKPGAALAPGDLCPLASGRSDRMGYAPSHDWALGGKGVIRNIVLPALVVLGVLCWAVLALLQACLSTLFGFGVALGIDARRPLQFDPRYPLRGAAPVVRSYLAQHVRPSGDAERGFSCLVREAIPLSSEIIFGDLVHDMDRRPPREQRMWQALAERDSRYQAALTVVLDWAWRVDAPSEAEAVEHLRRLLEGHYQALWDTLSRPEQIDLHHLASGRTVNAARAAPVIASLLTKGLVVLDPAPRLMNKSFAAFVRRVERSSTIREWAKAEGLSAWGASRLPLLIGAPALLVSISLVAFWTDLDPTKILPLFATGIPAIVAMLQKLRQQNAQ